MLKEPRLTFSESGKIELRAYRSTAMIIKSLQVCVPLPPSPGSSLWARSCTEMSMMMSPLDGSVETKGWLAYHLESRRPMIIALRAARPDYREFLLMTHQQPRIASPCCCLHICVAGAAAPGRICAGFSASIWEPAQSITHLPHFLWAWINQLLLVPGLRGCRRKKTNFTLIEYPLV